MAGRYSGEMRTPKRWSNGSALMKTCSPRALRQRALRMLGREASTSRVTGIWEERKMTACKGLNLLLLRSEVCEGWAPTLTCAGLYSVEGSHVH